MYFRILIAIAAVLALVVSSGSRAATTDMATLYVSAPSIDGWIHIAGEGAKWRCKGSCNVAYPAGSTVTLTVENGATSTFRSWERGCGGSQPTCAVQMAGITGDEVFVTARFWLRLWVPAFGAGSIAVEARDGGRLDAKPCGTECVDVADGQNLRLRAVENGARFTGWGGICERMRTKGCLLTPLRSSEIVPATFEVIPPQASQTPGTSGDPVTSQIEFVLQIIGKGTVVTGRMRDYPSKNCENRSASQSGCRIARSKGKWVELEAMTTSGGTFRGWGGRCRGTGTCRFYNDRIRNEAPLITAAFG